MGKILEFFIKSREELGIKLSDFNLTRYSIKKNKEYSVECLFQGSKVFEKEEPYQKNLICYLGEKIVQMSL